MRSVIFLVSLFVVFAITLGHGGHSTTHGVIDKYSIRPPYTPDHPRALRPWNLYGPNTKITSDYIRLTDNILNDAAVISNETPYSDNSIELTLGFHIHSPGATGADGMVLWIIDQPITRSGPAFGGPEKWNGLAVVMDTYDNDGKDPHPYIMIHRNDGSEAFLFAHDGESTFVGGCHAPYRNSEKTYVHLFIENELVNLYVDVKGDGSWVKCMEPAHIDMPKEYYFSISAATGGFSDYHDLLSFEVASMESRSIEIYKPPKELLSRTPKASENGNIPPECIIQSECNNLAALDEIVVSLDSLSEIIGHELLKVQTAIEESVSKIDSSVKPVASEISTRRSEVQSLRGALEEELRDVLAIRDSLSGPFNPGEDSKDLQRLTQSMANAQKTLSQISVDQKILAQQVDIQLQVVKETGINGYVAIALVFAVIQLIIICISACKKNPQSMHYF